MSPVSRPWIDRFDGGSRRVGYLQIVVGISLFATDALVIRLLELPAPVIVGARGLIVTVVLVTSHLIWWRGGLRLASSRLLVLGVGLCFAADYLLFTTGIQRGSVSTIITVAYLFPAITAGLSVVFLGERLHGRIIAALGVGLLGTIVVSFPDLARSDSSGAAPMFMGLGVALFASFQRILVKKLPSDLRSVTVITYKYGIIAILFGPALFPRLGILTQGQLVLVASSAILSGIVAATLLISGVRKVRTAEGAALGYIEPVVAVGLVWLFLQEKPSINAVIGGLIIFVSGYMVLRDARPATALAMPGDHAEVSK